MIVSPWDRVPEEQTNEMLAILARRVLQRRDEGLDPTDFSGTPWDVTPDQVIAYMDEARKRGIIT